MSNNILKELNVSVKILMVVFLIFMLFITDSIFFLAFEIVILLSDENVKKIVKCLELFALLFPFLF